MTAINPKERGVALVAACMATMLLLAVGAALVVATSAETAVAVNFRRSGEALYAATAVVEGALGELRETDWNLVLSGVVRSSFTDGPPGGTRRLADGTTLDLGQVVSLATCASRLPCSDGAIAAVTSARPWGADNPRWTLYAYGPLEDLAGPPAQASVFYVLLLVGDDGAENDGDPRLDGWSAGVLPNPGRDVIRLRGESFGPGGAYRVVEAVAARYRLDAADPLSPWRLQVRTWREY